MIKSKRPHLTMVSFVGGCPLFHESMIVILKHTWEFIFKAHNHTHTHNTHTHTPI